VTSDEAIRRVMQRAAFAMILCRVRIGVGASKVGQSQHDNPPPPDATRYPRRKSNAGCLNYTTVVLGQLALRMQSNPGAHPGKIKQPAGLLETTFDSLDSQSCCEQ
jgi:hypothetical protein